MNRKIPNTSYGLSLSNDLVCLLRRAEGDVWVPVSDVRTDDPDFDAKVRGFVDHMDKRSARAREVAVFLPFSEILFSFQNIPSETKEEAMEKVAPLLAEQTHYGQDELAFDIAYRAGKSVSPCAAIARATIDEAYQFVTSVGFDPVYFTARRNGAIFPQEPIFEILKEESETVIPYAMIGAVAATLLVAAVGFWQFSPVNAGTDGEDAPDTTVAALSAPEDSAKVDVSATLADPAPTTAQSPKILYASLGGTSTLESVLSNRSSKPEGVARHTPAALKASFEAPATFAEPRSTEKRLIEPDLVNVSYVRASRLPEQSAAENLPVVQDLSENPLIWSAQSAPPATLSEPIRLAAVLPSELGTLSPEGFRVFSGPPALTPPKRSTSKVYLASVPPRPKLRPGSSTVLGTDTQKPEDPLAALVEDALAEPEETPASTVQTDNDGGTAPSTEPKISDTEPAPLESPTTEAELTTPQNAPSGPDLLALASPELAGKTPKFRPGSETELATPPAAVQTPDSETPAADLSAPNTPIAPSPEPETAILPPTEPDPAPETERVQTPDTDPKTDTLAIANPELRAKRPKLRSQDSAEETIAPEASNLLALANPQLRGKRPSARPSTLRAVPAKPDGLLALQNPSLRGKKPANRPRNLRTALLVEEPPKPKADPVAPKPVEPAVKAPTPEEIEAERRRVEEERRRQDAERKRLQEQDAQRKAQAAERERLNNLARSSRLAVRRSPVPKKKSSRFGRSVQRTEQNIRTARLTPEPSRTAPGKRRTPEAKTTTRSTDTKFGKSRISLIGVYGKPSSRRALIRLPGGSYKRVKMGQRVSGWRVSAIGESTVRITKGARNRTLRLP